MTAPEVDDRAVRQVLSTHLGKEPDRRLALVHGRYSASAPTRFALQLGEDIRDVTVVDQHSVLGILGAWQAHQETHAAPDLLVVTTEIPDAALGWELRGHALRRRSLTVDRVDIVAQRFGASEVEPRLRREPWLFAALLDAEPAHGWPRSGPVLTLDTAVRALLGARLGVHETPDPGVLLEWSQTAGGPARFTELPADEQDGIGRWLGEAVGPFAAPFTALVRQGRAADVTALGAVLSVLESPDVPAEVSIAVGGLLGGAPTGTDERRALVTAVQGLLERWIVNAEAGGPAGEEARRRLLRVLDRADALARGAGLAAAVDDHPFLPSGLRGRERAVAATLTGTPGPGADAAASAALEHLRRHQLVRVHPSRLGAATMAVRLLRWLVADRRGPDSVPNAVADHVRDGGWVDRALTAVWAGAEGSDAAVGHAYGVVYDAVRCRRDADDQRFALRLATWTEHAAAVAPGGALLVEAVLADVAVPLLGLGAPLVIVVDGMSAAVAAELGEQILDRSYTEIGRDELGREAAVAVVPSVTRASRCSLLAGTAVVGDQRSERDGFAAFWKRYGRAADLLHKSDLAGGPGRRLSESLIADLADDDVVVGVVLNTVDDALDHGREGDRTGWRLHDITYLPDLLDAARGYGRPVLLVSDHGHVLDRSTATDRPTEADGVESARWRTGTPGDGEVALAGPRVLEGGGRVVVPWREDIRYTRRRSGYHGGASLAEMAVPVLVFLPEATPDLPMGWSVLAPEATRPPWWNGHAPSLVTPTTRLSRPSTKRRAAPSDGQGVLDIPTPPSTPSTLGHRVVVTALFTQQKTFVRRAPEPGRVAALIDALMAAGGELSATAAVAALDRPGRAPAPVLAHVQRLLNVEGYPVLSSDGRTVRLDVETLCLQFGVSVS